TGAAGATDARAQNLEFTDIDLIDHRYNLSPPAVAYSVDALKVVDFPTGGGATELRVMRVDRVDVPHFDDTVASGERITFDPAKRLVTGFEIDSLPIVPIDESIDLASDRARRARLDFHAEATLAFARGALTGLVRLVLDADRIDDAVDTAAGAGWLAAEPAAVQRRCALLETTFVAAPSIPTRSILRIEDAAWRCDAVSLADGADIMSPAAPPNVNTRRLTGRWVPILERTFPRLTGLLVDRNVFLAPG